VNFTANYWASMGMPKEKIVIGIPFYGHGWRLTNPADNGVYAPASGPSPPFPYTQQAGVAAYYEICPLVNAPGNTRTFDPYQYEPYIVTSSGLWFSYDDVESLNYKVDCLKRNGFAGTMVWALDMDDFNGICPQHNGQKYPLTNAINAALTGSATTTPPRQTTTTRRITRPQTTTTTRRTTIPPKTTKTTAKAPTTTRAGSTTAKAPTTNGPFVCPGDGLFPDPKDCNMYYDCSNGNAFHMRCPAGLYFNPKTSTCDFPFNVPCDN